MALQISQILYTFVLRAEVCTTFGSKVVQTSARNTKVYKTREICTTIFSAFYNISRPNFAILLTLRCSFYSCSDGFSSSCLDQNLVYSRNHPLKHRHNCSRSQYKNNHSTSQS